MPETAERLWRALGYGEGPAEGSWQTALEWVPAGQALGNLADEAVTGLTEYLQQAG